MIVNGESITIYYQVLFDQDFTLCLIVYQKMIVNPWKEQGQVFDMQLQGGGGTPIQKGPGCSSYPLRVKKSSFGNS